MATKEKDTISSSKPIKEPKPPEVMPWGTGTKFTKYEARDVKVRDRKILEKNRNKWLNEDMQVSTAAGNMLGVTRQINNSQSHSATLYRKIDLIHYIQDPHTFAEKQLMEAAMRRNFCVRVSIWIRELMAFKKSKLVIELPQWKKMQMSEDEIKAETDKYMNMPAVQDLLEKFETRDQNLKVPLNIRKCFWQAMGFGRFCTIIFYKNTADPKDSYSEINRLLTVNSRRLEEPVLDESNDLSFEGIYIDGEALDKDSCIYGLWQERDISPHSEGYGYSPTEPVIYIAQAHSILLEEDVGEIVKSAWLPTLLLKLDVTGANKSTSIANIINKINPGKIVGVPSEDVDGEPVMLNMEADFDGIVKMGDSLEEKIYNNYHIPLFLVKSDKIANLATAKKSLLAFKDGTVADDQEQMEEIWAEQWYMPLLRDEIKKNPNLISEQTSDETADNESVDTAEPSDDEMPLPFIIKRKFDPPNVEDVEDIKMLIDGKIIDLEESHNRLGIPSDVTQRMLKQRDVDQAKFEENMNDNQDPKSQDPKTQPFRTPYKPKPATPTGSYDALKVAKANLVNELAARVKADKERIKASIAKT